MQLNAPQRVTSHRIAAAAIGVIAHLSTYCIVARVGAEGARIYSAQRPIDSRSRSLICLQRRAALRLVSMSRLPPVKIGEGDVDMNKEVSKRTREERRRETERGAALTRLSLDCCSALCLCFAVQVESFFRVTGLGDVSSLSDDDLFAVLSSPAVAVCRWDATLSLAHPRLASLLDDLDERLRRFVRYYQLDHPEYARKEEEELAEIDKGETRERRKGEAMPRQIAALAHLLLTLCLPRIPLFARFRGGDDSRPATSCPRFPWRGVAAGRRGE